MGSLPTRADVKGDFGDDRSEEAMAEEKGKTGRDELAQSLGDVFINVSTMIKGELQVPCLVVSSIPFHDVTCVCLVTESALF